MKIRIMGFAILIVLLTVLPLASAATTNVDFYITDVQPKEVQPGETVTLNITMKNLGLDYAVYVKGILDPNDATPIDQLGPAKIFLTKKAKEAKPSEEFFGIVLQGDELSAQYTVHIDKDAKLKVYQVPFKIIWRDQKMELNEDTLHFGIKVVGEPNLILAEVNTTPSKVYPEDDFSISAKIENIGNGDAKSAELKLGMPEGFSGGTSAFLGTIKKDEFSSAVFNLKAGKEVKSKSHIFTLHIDYMDESGVKRSTDKDFDVFISEHGEIKIEIAGVTTSPPKIYPGDDFTLSVQLENTGRQDAKSVKLELAPLQGISGERTSFIGSLKKDDTSTAIFDLSASKEAEPKNYEIAMKVIYTDEKSSEYTEEKRFGIMVLKKPQKFSFDLRLAGAGAVGLIIVLFLLRRRSSAAGEV